MTTHFQWVKGHNGTRENEESDSLAKEGAEKNEEDHLDLEIPNEYNLQEAKLATLTQATTYQVILERATPPTRTSMNSRL